MKALVVEDSPGMLKIVAAMLRKLGYDPVLTATHGGEALQLLQSEPVDLILTDWNMPIMSGLDLLKQVRRSPRFGDTPVVIFTARNVREDVVAALKAGADSYLTKPFTPQELRDKLSHLSSRRSDNQVGRLLAAQDPMKREDEHPLTIFGEGAVTEEQLSRSDNQPILAYLSAAVDSLSIINSRSEDIHIGYALFNSSTDITKRLRSLRTRVRMLFLSTDMGSNAVSLARVSSISSRLDLQVFVVCDSVKEFDTKTRYGLERLDIHLVERHLLDAEAFEGLFTEYIIAPTAEGPPAALPSPEEIRERLDRDIRTMVDLPVLPQVYQQIVTLDQDPASELDQWTEAIEADPLSSAQVIRRSRSPLYGFRGEVTETGRAVVLLGKDAVKEIIVSGAVKKSLEGVNEEGFNVEDYWVHSVAVGTVARILSLPLDEAQQTPDQRREFETLKLEDEALELLRAASLWTLLSLDPRQDPFTGGIMHDIGKVALAHGYPGLFGAIVRELSGQGWQFPMRLGEESVTGGASHAMVGGILAESWGLGADIRAVIERHHEEEPGHPFVGLIAVANFLANGLYPFPADGQYPAREILNGSGDIPVEGDLFAPFVSKQVVAGYNLRHHELLGIGRALAPAVRRVVEDIRSTV